MKKKNYAFYITFIMVLLFQYITLFGQASRDNVSLEDVSLNDYIYPNINKYIIVTDEFRLVNATTFNIRYIFIQKVEDNKTFSGYVNYLMQGENFSNLNVAVFKFDDKGEIIKNYVTNYDQINNFIKISTNFSSGYNAVIIGYSSYNRKEPPQDIWNFSSDMTANLNMTLSNETLFRSFELEVPLPKSHNIEITPVGYFYTGTSLFFIPVSSIKIKDNSFDVKFVVINNAFRDKINKIGFAFDFDSNPYLKATFKNKLRYEPVTTYDLLFVALYSFIGAIILGFIFFWLQWRRIEKEKK